MASSSFRRPPANGKEAKGANANRRDRSPDRSIDTPMACMAANHLRRNAALRIQLRSIARATTAPIRDSARSAVSSGSRSGCSPYRAASATRRANDAPTGSASPCYRFAAPSRPACRAAHRHSTDSPAWPGARTSVADAAGSRRKAGQNGLAHDGPAHASPTADGHACWR
jgi:hypothetical protein